MNKTEIYDKAKWHYEGNYPKDIGMDNAYTHTGYYLAWLIEQRMISQEIESSFGDVLADCRLRYLSPASIFKILGGALVSDMITDEGNCFTGYYYDLENGKYLEDYLDVLARGLPSIYHVEDSWEIYERIRLRIQMRYEEWRISPTACSTSRSAARDS